MATRGAGDARAGERAPVRRVAFDRAKYGRELLIDVEWVHDIPTFILDAPHALDFFDILVVTRGRGEFSLDGHRHLVEPGIVLFTSPGQVREWRVEGLDGICLFFLGTFVREFLQDDAFLDRLPYFRRDPARAAMRLTPSARSRMRERLEAMRRELAEYRADSTPLLQAQLHETLIVVAREYASAHGVPARHATHGMVSRYVALVERAPTSHRVADYAVELGVSPGHLNVLCGRYAGRSAKQLLHDALVTRARRMLLFTDDSAARIAAALGFTDPSYFSRFFRRATGLTPGAFRAGHATSERRGAAPGTIAAPDD